MNKSNIRFLSSVLVMSALGITSVCAAPSVKMLGANTARVGANTAVVKSNNVNTSSTQRLGSIRPKTISSGVPVTVNKVVSKTNNDADTDSEARLSLGKYIHSTGVASGTIKPTSAAVGVTSNDFVSLVDRVSNLETSVESKQAALSVGEGLVLQDNVISLDTAALPEQVAGIQEQVNNIEDNYYTADEVDAILEEHGVISGPTYTSVTNEENTYNAIDIADEFDEEFDFVN